MAQYRQDEQNLIAALHSLLYFHQEPILKEIKDTKMLIDKWITFMGDTFHISADILPRFIEIFSQSKRHPNGLLIYATRLRTLPEHQLSRLMPLLGRFATAVLNGSFPEIRYDFTNNKHLKTLFSSNPELLEKWKTSLPIKIAQESNPPSMPDLWTVEDTDSWEDLLLMGTEVGSCQNIYVGPESLLAYLLDGKNRLIVAKDPSGKIMGRVVLRILWDKAQKKPVLFVERLYTRGENPQSVERDILEGCKQKAKSMGLPLVASARDYKHLKTDKYPGTLDALGGPAPYEYVDAIGGLQNDAIYSIEKSYLLWSPSK